MARPRQYIRPALTLLALFLAGAAINVLAAWACARWGDHRPTGTGSAPKPVETVPPEAHEFVNDPRYLAEFGYHGPPPPRTEFVTVPSLEEPPELPGGLPTGLWGRPRERSSGLEMLERRSILCTRVEFTRWFDRPLLAYSRTHTCIRFGLPLRSMELAERESFNTAAFPEFGSWRVEGWRGGWPISPARRPGRLGRPAHVYPLTPIPLGFTINTLLYALLLYTLFLAPRHLRRRSRRRRGLCLKCAYPIGVSSVCTECGAEVSR